MAPLTNPHRIWRKCPLYPWLLLRYAHLSLIAICSCCSRLKVASCFHSDSLYLPIGQTMLQKTTNFAVFLASTFLAPATRSSLKFFVFSAWLLFYLISFFFINLFSYFNECHSARFRCKFIQIIPFRLISCFLRHFI